MLLGAAMAVIGGGGLAVGLHLWWPAIFAAVFAIVMVGIALR